MKKKLAMMGAVLILIGSVVWWGQPRPMVGADYEVHFVRTGEKLLHVTEQIDIQALEALLQNRGRGPVQKYFSPYQLTEKTVEITGRDSHGVWHILMNEGACVVYDSADKGGYPIQNPEALWDAVLELMPEC